MIGIFNDSDNFKIVYTGTRRTAEDWKLSFHFIFQILLTMDQFIAVWKLFVNYIEDNFATISASLSDGKAHIDEIETMHGYECLIGVDKHPYLNPEQGLAMGFSRKNGCHPYSRFIEILHIQGAKEIRSEAALDGIWVGREFGPNFTQEPLR